MNGPISESLRPIRSPRQLHGGASENRIELLFHSTSVLVLSLSVEQPGSKNQRVNVGFQKPALLKAAAPLGLRPRGETDDHSHGG